MPRQSSHSHLLCASQKMDAQRIRDFILQHSPHVVLIGSSVPEAEQLKVDIQQISDKIMEITPEFLTRSDTGGPVYPTTSNWRTMLLMQRYRESTGLMCCEVGEVAAHLLNLYRSRFGECHYISLPWQAR